MCYNVIVSKSNTNIILKIAGLVLTRYCYFKYRGVEQWKLVGFITQRSQVRVLSPQPIFKIHTNAYKYIQNIFKKKVVDCKSKF